MANGNWVFISYSLFFQFYLTNFKCTIIFQFVDTIPISWNEIQISEIILLMKTCILYFYYPFFNHFGVGVPEVSGGLETKTLAVRLDQSFRSLGYNFPNIKRTSFIKIRNKILFCFSNYLKTVQDKWSFY